MRHCFKMTYYFEFCYVSDLDKAPIQYTYLRYDGSVHTKDERMDYYYSKQYPTFRQVLKKYHRLILKTGQQPRPCFYFQVAKIGHEKMSQSVSLYNYYVKHYNKGCT